MTTDRWRRSALLLAGLWPLVATVSRSALPRRKRPEMRSLAREILRTMRSGTILFGRTTIVVAEKA